MIYDWLFQVNSYAGGRPLNLITLENEKFQGSSASAKCRIVNSKSNWYAK